MGQSIEPVQVEGDEQDHDFAMAAGIGLGEFHRHLGGQGAIPVVTD